MSDTQHDQDGLTPRKKIVMGLLADDVPRGKNIKYSDRVYLVRQDRDRALYSVYLDGEHQTAIDTEMVPASHRLRKYLDSLHEEEQTDDDLTGWH